MRTTCFVMVAALMLLLPSVGSATWWKKVSYSLPCDLNFSGEVECSVTSKEYRKSSGKFRSLGKWYNSVLCCGSSDFYCTTYDLSCNSEPVYTLSKSSKNSKSSSNCGVTLCPLQIECDDCTTVCIEFDGPLTVKSYAVCSYVKGCGKAIICNGCERECIPVEVNGLIVKKGKCYYLTGTIQGTVEVYGKDCKTYKCLSAKFCAEGQQSCEKPCYRELECGCYEENDN